MTSWHAASKDILMAMIDLLVPCAHRWRSLIIRDSVPYFHLSLVLQKMMKIGYKLSFPSLNFDEVSNDWNSRFLRPGSACQLEYLELGRQFVVSANFKIPTCLSTLQVLELRRSLHPWTRYQHPPPGSTSKVWLSRDHMSVIIRII